MYAERKEGAYVNEVFVTVKQGDNFVSSSGGYILGNVNVDTAYEQSLTCGNNMYFYNGTLFSVSNNKVSVIEEDVVGCAFSADGNTAVYLCDDVISVYKNGNKAVISNVDNGSIYNVIVATLSPDGETVLYGYFEDFDEKRFMCYSYKGGKAEKVDKNIVPLSVSNNGAVAYIYDTDTERFSAMKNLDSDQTVKLCKTVTSLYFSSDKSKILFYGSKNDDQSSMSTYYYNPSLEDLVKVSGNSVIPIYPQFSNCTLNDFTDFVAILSDNSIRRLKYKNGDFTDTKIVSDCEAYQLSINGKKLIFKNKNKLYSISTTDENAEKVELARNVRRFTANAELSKIFITNNDGELVFSNGKDDNVKEIADDVANITVNAEGVCVYIRDEGLGYSSGDAGKKINGINDCSSISCDGDNFFAWNDGTLYVSTNGKDFTKTKIERS